MTLNAHILTASDGTELNLWEQPTATNSDEAVVFVHGAITNSRALFAPPVEDDNSYSWLKATTDFGKNAYALDIRGYGDSEQPPAFDEPPTENDPVARAKTVKEDVRAAVEFAQSRHETVHLVGVSWGTMTIGRYLDEYDPDIATFTSCAPVYKPEYDFTLITEALGVDRELDAYMIESREEVLERRGDPDSTLFEAVWEAQAGSRQGMNDRDAYVGPLGAFKDTIECCRGNPPYNPEGIAVPTLVIRGRDDAISQRPDATTLFDELAVSKRVYTEIAGANHYAMQGEYRHNLFQSVDMFQDQYTG